MTEEKAVLFALVAFSQLSALTLAAWLYLGG